MKEKGGGGWGAGINPAKYTQKGYCFFFFFFFFFSFLFLSLFLGVMVVVFYDLFL